MFFPGNATAQIKQKRWSENHEGWEGQQQQEVWGQQQQGFIPNQSQWGSNLNGPQWVNEKNKNSFEGALDISQVLGQQVILLEPSPAKQKLAELQKLGQKFVDDKFPPDASSLSGQYGPQAEWKQITWEKVMDKMSSPKIFQGKVEPGDIKQGYLGDCYFLAGLAALAEKPHRIFNLFLEDLNPIHYFSVKILYKGKWVTVDLDEYVPYFQNQPAFSKSNDNELWVILLEKAWAKLYTSYKRIEVGCPQEPLHDLTGAPIKQLYLQHFSKEEDWEYLVEASIKQYSMVASSQPGSDTSKTGVQGHAYTVLNATVLQAGGEQHRIIQLRNPWGKCEFKGKWSNGDPSWNSVGEAEKKRVGYNPNIDDGIFFMPYDDFLSEFRAITIAEIDDNASYIYKSYQDKQCKGVYFSIQIFKDSEYSFQVDKTPERIYPDRAQEKFQYPEAQFEIGKINGNSCQKYQGLRSETRTLFQKQQLAPGKYVAWVRIAYDPKFQADFDVNLAVYAPFACTVQLASRQQAVIFSGDSNVQWAGQDLQGQKPCNSQGNIKLQQGGSDRNQEQMFDFPQSLQKVQTSGSLKEIQEVLRAEYNSKQMSKQICPQFPFKFASYIYHKKRYARAKCRFCKSFINWIQKEEGGPLHLTKYRISHDHRQIYIVQSARSKVVSYLQTIDNRSEIKNIQLHLAEVFNVSRKYIQKLTRLWYGKWGNNLKEVASSLKQKGISFNYWPTASKIPQVTVIITPEMRRMYSECGFSIKLDYTFKVIRDKAELVGQGSPASGPQGQNLLLGLISGVNSYNRIVVFGIAIVSGETSFNIRKSLEYFFNFMGEECEAIVTDLSSGVQGAISSMNEDFFIQKVTHILDHYLVIQNLEFGKGKEDLIKYKIASKILKSVTVPEFNFKCELFEKELPSNSKSELVKLKRLASRCCMAMVQTNGFIGPSISTNSSQSLNNLIKRKLTFSVPYLQLIPRILDICQSINKKATNLPNLCRFEIQKLCDVEDISLVRHILPKKMFEIILTNLLQSRHVSIIGEQGDQIWLSEFGENITLIRASENQIWKCQCMYSDRSGLPCRHLMKIIKKVGPYIHQFWSNNQEKTFVSKAKKQVTHKRKR